MHEATPRLAIEQISPEAMERRAAGAAVERAPVLIVGGGLVGLSMALFLAQQGVQAVVVERHPGTAVHPRARGFHAPTVELLAPSGVAARMLALGASLRATDRLGILRAVTLRGPVLSWSHEPLAPGQAEHSPFPLVALGQDRLEPLLLAAAREGGASVRFGRRAVAFAEGPEGVSVLVEGPEEGVLVRMDSPYMVAADGAASGVREALGIERSGRGLLGHQISTLLHADLTSVSEHPFAFAQVTHPEAAGVFVGTEVANRWIYGTSYDPSSLGPGDFTPDDWARRIRLAAGDPGLALRTEGAFRWEAAERVATRWRTSRIFLAGDAAHQMPPTGGWGANVGMQDAANLAWKLAWVLQGRAGEGLLDSYERERRPVAAATADQAARLARRMGKPDASDEGLVDDDAVVFGYRYGDEPLTRHLALDGRPGSRAPHVWLPGPPGGERRSTRSLLGSGLWLLAGDDAWLAAARALAERGLGLRALRGDGWQRAFGVGPAGASLLRPDGFVAARWPDLVADPLAAVGGAARELLCA